jgi:hypothetical protein
MKSKMNPQVQPPEVLVLHNQQAEQELMTFLLAVDSYPDRASREPGVSFHQHLSSFLPTEREVHYDNRSGRR